MSDRQQADSDGTVEGSALPPFALGLLLTAVLCAAVFLRFYRLDAQSLWNDEGNSARIAERSIDLIIEGAAGDIHPPGYYLLLHVWRGLFGQSEFALRSLSVASGGALVLLTGLLGWRLFGRSVGLLAATLNAFSPFAVYYSQEARMYALLGALSAAATLAAFWFWERLPAASQDEERGFPVWTPLSYALIAAAGLYTHYAFVLVLMAHNLLFALWWIRRSVRFGPNWRGLIPWVIAQFGAALLYVPWIRVALNAAGWSSAGGDYGLGPAMLDVIRVLTVGLTLPLDEAGFAIAAAVGLLIASLWPVSGEEAERDGEPLRWWSAAGLLAFIIVVLALFFALDLYKPAWLKFLIVLLAPFHVLIALGIRNAAKLVSGALASLALQRRVMRPLVSAILVASLGVLVYPSLQNLYFDPVYARDDYRQLAEDVQEMRRPGDAIVLNAPNQWEVFTYYYPDRDVYPAPYRPEPGGSSSFLDPLLDEYQRLFVVYWGDAESDPRREIESWFAAHAYKAGDRWYGDVRLSIYGVAPLPQEPNEAARAVFGERILLEGYAVGGDGFAAGQIVPVSLFWRALRTIEEPYKVSVQMLDSEGRLMSQIDTVPGDGLAPTGSWRTGERFIDRYGVSIPRGTPPGRYSLIAVVYHAASQQRLAVDGGEEALNDAVSLGDIVVEPGR